MVFIIAYKMYPRPTMEGISGGGAHYSAHESTARQDKILLFLTTITADPTLVYTRPGLIIEQYLFHNEFNEQAN